MPARPLQQVRTARNPRRAARQQASIQSWPKIRTPTPRRKARITSNIPTIPAPRRPAPLRRRILMAQLQPAFPPERRNPARATVAPCRAPEPQLPRATPPRNKAATAPGRELRPLSVPIRRRRRTPFRTTIALRLRAALPPAAPRLQMARRVPTAIRSAPHRPPRLTIVMAIATQWRRMPLLPDRAQRPPHRAHRTIRMPIRRLPAAQAAIRRARPGIPQVLPATRRPPARSIGRQRPRRLPPHSPLRRATTPTIRPPIALAA